MSSSSGQFTAKEIEVLQELTAEMRNLSSRFRSALPGDYLSVRDVAGLMSVSVRTVKRWILDDGLPAGRKGNMVRVRRRDLDEWLFSQNSTTCNDVLID